jgi:GntR family transcriptional regulator
MSPFRFTLKPGEPIFDQVVFAATKAIATRAMPPGQPFPSVRTLAADLKIHPNTALKVIQRLTEDGLLEVRPGIGTVVAAAPRASHDRTAIEADVERLMVNAKRAGLTLAEVIDALRKQWKNGAPVDLVVDDHRVRKTR